MVGNERLSFITEQEPVIIPLSRFNATYDWTRWGTKYFTSTKLNKLPVRAATNDYFVTQKEQ